MRYIPTPAAVVTSLKRQAKKLQRRSGGRHTELLDRIAQDAGYQHWHHVAVCAKTTQANQSVDALHADREGVVCATQDDIGMRAILGHPQGVDKAPSFYPPYNTSLTYQGTVDLTPELAERLVSKGWARSKIEDLMCEGARYSPRRGSLVHALPGMFD